ncbi:MAG: molybdopterin-dependent oxidoreductase [Sphingomonas sp.]|nr:molybdopterin-dependent oxidoreductase [Sphingomonas sp.]
MKAPEVSRRTLLIGGGAGIGLLVAFLSWPRREEIPHGPGQGEALFGAYLRIGQDGRVTLAVPQAETGQGIWTGLAQIAADELGAAWENMAVEPAPLGAVYSNLVLAREFGLKTRITAASSSIRAFEQPIREAAAIARALLCRAAADRWGVNAAECDSSGGFVIHEGKRTNFGELAVDAAGMSPPDEPPLRPSGTGRIAGEALPRLDLPSKIDGSFRFASDVRLPNMLFASVRMAPPGGQLTGFSRAGAEHQKGLARLVVDGGWLAAVGESWWAADNALSRASPRFTGPDVTDIRQRLLDRLESGERRKIFEQGNYAAETEGASTLAATYLIEPAHHRPLEAPSAVARAGPDRLEVWVGTQVPDLARAAAAAAAGLGEHQVTIYPMPVGDGSGSGFELETVGIAARLARESGRPVNLLVPHATAQNRDPVRPPLAARLSALPSFEGGLRSWRAIVAGQAGIESLLARAAGNGEATFDPRGAIPPYGIGAIRVDAIDSGLPILTGYMRGGIEAITSFATESFIDEMARRLGAEPLSFRIGLLGGAPRLAQALMSAAKIGGWDGGGPGSSMGLACASLFGSHIGLLAEASIDPDQRVSVSRLVAAVDAGRIINPGLVRQQIEGGLLAALAAARMSPPEYVAGMPRAAPIRGHGFERLDRVPSIEVEIIRSDAGPGGISGLGMAVLAPAVANALAAGTGKRLRNLPFDPMSAS